MKVYLDNILLVDRSLGFDLKGLRYGNNRPNRVVIDMEELNSFLDLGISSTLLKQRVNWLTNHLFLAFDSNCEYIIKWTEYI